MNPPPHTTSCWNSISIHRMQFCRASKTRVRNGALKNTISNFGGCCPWPGGPVRDARFCAGLLWECLSVGGGEPRPCDSTKPLASLQQVKPSFLLTWTSSFWPLPLFRKKLGQPREKWLKMEVGRETRGSRPGKFSLSRACEREARPRTKEGQGLLKKAKGWRQQ